MKNKTRSHRLEVIHKTYCASIQGTKEDGKSFSPFYLIFGRELNVPIDVMFVSIPHVFHMSKYIVSLRNRLKFSHDLASKHIQASREKQKRNYDVKERAS